MKRLSVSVIVRLCEAVKHRRPVGGSITSSQFHHALPVNSLKY